MKAHALALWVAVALVAPCGCSESAPEVVNDAALPGDADTSTWDARGDVPFLDQRSDVPGDTLPPADILDVRADLLTDLLTDLDAVEPTDLADSAEDVADADVADTSDTVDVVIPPTACYAVSPEWVLETCDAANVVVWDGQKCVGTCMGCCGCDPFCDQTFENMEQCQQACTGTCPLYNGALAEGPFQYFIEYGAQPACPSRIAREVCNGDYNCPIPELGEAGQYCVQGNCVFCWDDTNCAQGEMCRMGRCVAKNGAYCPTEVPCSEPGCKKVTLSETGCPVCICDSLWNYPCATDNDCLVFSFHPFRRCVYGRCADCKEDADCGLGEFACHAPGICSSAEAVPSGLWGTWLIGWFGALDHYSYLRFEPDGVLRRGHYVSDSLWMDDTLMVPCSSGETEGPFPYLGTWELVVSAAPELQVRVTLNASCDAGVAYDAVWMITLGADGQSLTVDLGEGTMPFEGYRQSPDVCTADFSLCELPSYPWP